MSKVVCVHLYSSTQKERTENKYFLENGFPNLSSTFFFFFKATPAAYGSLQARG